MINTDLCNYAKSTTNDNIYKTLFLSIADKYKSLGWNLLFTDASKTDSHTSFAVVDENGSVFSKGLLPNFSSIFTAEAFAIFKAIKCSNKKKTVIFSDSLSTISAVKNISNSIGIVETIRDLLISNSQTLKIVWIPGHTGIRGNEAADTAARSAIKEPLKMFYQYNKKDINILLLANWKYKRKNAWTNYNHTYKNFNPNGVKPIYPNNVSQKKLKIYIRLRLGHSYITHKHLFNKESPALCHLCEEKPTLTMSHLLSCKKVLSTCKSISDHSLTYLLSNVNIDHITHVFNILTALNLVNSI